MYFLLLKLAIPSFVFLTSHVGVKMNASPMYSHQRLNIQFIDVYGGTYIT